MWELVLGLQKAQIRGVPAPLVGWRQEFDRRLAGADRGVDAVSLLRCLVAPRGNFPDFLTPPGPVVDVEAGCEAMMCTSRARLGTDLADVFARRVAPPWVRSLASGDREMMSEAVRAARAGHQLLVAPHWAEVCNVVRADRLARAKQLAAHGVGALLANLPGALSWDGRVLRTGYPVDRTVFLGGRGLVLVPSYFCWGNPVTWIDSELPPVLVYQAFGHQSRSAPRSEATISDRLVTLLGRTRAECLRVLLVPRTTTGLAVLAREVANMATRDRMILE